LIRLLKILGFFGLFFTVILSCKKNEIEIPPFPDMTDTTAGYQCKTTPYSLIQPTYFPPYPTPILNIEMTEERIALGRKLFYETKLSGDNTMSCASCHNQNYAFTDNKRALSIGIDGKSGTKNSMALFNLAYSPAFFWDGRSSTLEKQVLVPVIDPIEMHETWKNAIVKLKGEEVYNRMFYEAFCTADYDSTHAAKAITQFELTLVSSNSIFDKAVDRTGNDRNIGPQFGAGEEQISRGFRIFNGEVSKNGGGGDCFHCHSTDNMLFTNNDFMNNGLDDNPSEGFFVVTRNETNRGQFKVPTLRNVEHTGPYMHDGRFETLEEVVEFYNSGIRKNSINIEPIMVSGDTANGSGSGIADGLNLTTQEKADLVAFLKALSDSDFLNNKDFSDPN
tara:strand:+ start:25019 stop:26194 length:1176 start_codon:yes stop_codon:yes gene_type:complete